MRKRLNIGKNQIIPISAGDKEREENMPVNKKYPDFMDERSPEEL